MSIKAVLFDLDGTLLPMDQEVFTKAYFKGLCKKLAPYGYEPESLIKAIWNGTYAMIGNDGSISNEDCFWQEFAKLYGRDVRKDEPHFDAFYRNEFQNVKEVCGCNPKAKELIDRLKSKGIRIALATNPIFPLIATESRIAWSGLDVSDFELITTYDNIGFCKPNPKYYKEIINRMELLPEECIMVGNDVGDDMVAQSIGMQVFLLTDCMINKNDADIADFSQGDFDALSEYIEKLI